MNAIRQSFRQWWQPPRRLADREAERSVTFLELFYDLVYVALVAELAHALAGDLGWAGIGRFAFLYIIVWWAWFNGSSYHDLHGNNDIRTRVFTFLQMGTVAAMAVFAHNALGDGATGFALSYAAFQLILLVLWWRTGVHDPAHRPLSRPYVAGFAVTTLLFAGSVFVPEPVRYYLWGAALLISLLLPLTSILAARNNPEVQAQVDLATAFSPSLVERFGLLTIIVLGEVVVAVVSGVAGHDRLSWQIGITAVLGLLIAVGLWWIYFDFVSQRKPRPTMAAVSQWSYLHLPITAAIAATGAAVLNIIEQSGEPLDTAVRWLLVAAIALIFFCVALLMQSLKLPPEQIPLYRRGGVIVSSIALTILLSGFIPLPVIPFLLVVLLLMLIPIVYGIQVWIRVFGANDIPIA